MRKRICFVVSSPHTAKAFLENHFEKLAPSVDVYLVANFDTSNWEGYNNRFLVETKHISIERKISPWLDIKALSELIKYFKDGKFDAVTTFTPKAGLLGILAAKIAGIKLRIHFFTGQVWHTKVGLIRKALMFFDRVVVYFSTNVIVDGGPQRDFLIANRIVNERNSILLGKGTISGIDLGTFSSKPDVRCLIRNKMGFSQNVFVFLFLGRLNHDKGVIELVQAFKKLNGLYPNTRLLIVGPDEENITGKVSEIMGGNANCLILGPTDTPEVICQVCDVFCLPSHREAFGLSIIEASACEKPVICSDTYGLNDTIIDGITGLRHITKDVDSIFSKMETLNNDVGFASDLGKAGRNYVEKYFDKVIVTDLWLKYFKNLLDIN